ncbi:MAG: hypothetical protein ACRD3L_12505 [Terriglobales bacterium]
MRKVSLAGLALLLVLGASLPAFAAAQDTPAQKPAASSKASTAPSASEVAAARASHKVWVNLDTGIYHKGGRWYGKTKTGKFMTVDDAKKAGYKAAKRD